MHQHIPDLKKAQYVKKGKQVAALRERFTRAHASILIEYRGMTVKETTELRTRLRKVDAELNVSKNTLIKRAMSGTGVTGLDSYLEGPTAVVFAFDDAVAAVKAVSDFTRDSKLLVIKAGQVEGTVYNPDQLKDIARMPPREQIIAQLLGSLQAPAANLVGMIQAPILQLALTLQAIGETAE